MSSTKLLRDQAEAANIKTLNDKQEMFCREYLVDLNQTQAAIRAGYSQHTAGVIACELLNKPNIRLRIKELMDERKGEAMIDAVFVIKSLVNVANKCQEIEPVMVWDKEQRGFVESGQYKFDSQGANKALELLGKHLELFTDKTKMSGEVANPLNAEALQAIAAKINSL